MNESVLKLFTLSMIGLVVVFALWLAGSVQAAHQSPSSTLRVVQTKPVSGPHYGLTLVALPAERAASAAMTRTYSVR